MNNMIAELQQVKQTDVTMTVILGIDWRTGVARRKFVTNTVEHSSRQTKIWISTNDPEQTEMTVITWFSKIADRNLG